MVGGRVAPFVPAPLEVVRAALEAGWAGPCDSVYDLGSGDGRVLVVAARDFCVGRAVGVELDPVLVEVARVYAEEYGVTDRVEVVEADFFRVGLQGATLVYLYLYRSVNEALRGKLEAELRPGARVVTVDFPVPGWRPVYVRRLRDRGDILRSIYVYVVGVSDSRWSGAGRRLCCYTGWLHCLGASRPGCPSRGAGLGAAGAELSG